MKIKLKKGLVQSTIKTTFGGVYFLEGEEQYIDDTKILNEERAKIKSDFEIIDARGCKWIGGSSKSADSTVSQNPEENQDLVAAKSAFESAKKAVKEAAGKAKKDPTPENKASLDAAKEALSVSLKVIKDLEK